MAGYHGYSMSNNAVAAYSNGKRPKTKWTKALILDDIKSLTIDSAEELDENAESLEQLKKKFELLKKCSVETLRKHLLRYSEWHHTSSRYNKTDFYEVDDEAFINASEKEITEWKNESHELHTSPCKKGTITYLVWYGSLKHPKAYEATLRNMLIQEKGSFYYVYDPAKSNKLVLKKKIGGRGTTVRYRK